MKTQANIHIAEQGLKKSGPIRLVLAFISNLYRSLFYKNIRVTGIGVQRDTNFNVFFQFSYATARSYNLGSLEIEANNRYNLNHCRILNLTESKEISFTFTPVKQPAIKELDRVQYLELT